MSREPLYELIERISERRTACRTRRFLEYLLVHPAYRMALTAAPDDEPVTQADAAAIDRARDEVRLGKVFSHDEVLGGNRPLMKFIWPGIPHGPTCGPSTAKPQFESSLPSPSMVNPAPVTSKHSQVGGKAIFGFESATTALSSQYRPIESRSCVFAIAPKLIAEELG